MLSRTDDALAQIPGTDLVEFEKAWTLLGNAFNRTGWLQVMLQDEDIDANEVAELNQWLDEWR